MLWNLDPSWQIMAVAIVAVLSYFFGSALDVLMREDGFGSFGNALIIAGSFFASILGANHEGYNLREMHVAVLVGLAGAFVVLALLAALKALLARL